MGVFTRISDLIAANINALLDRAEDPEKMLAQVIREMEQGLVSARQRGARAVAAERRLERELEQNRQQGEFWKERARRALAEGREELARRALVRKIQHDDLVCALEPQWAAARRTSAEVKTALRALEARLAEARRKQRVLIAQHQAIRVRHEVQGAKNNSFDLQGPFAKFAYLENRLADLNDDLLAQIEVAHSDSELESDFSELETSKRIEEELIALKGGHA